MDNQEVLHEAIARLWNELELLFGEDWPSVERRLFVLLRGLESEGRSQAEEDIRELFRSYPEAERRLLPVLGELRPRTVWRGVSRAVGTSRKRYCIVPVFFGTSRNASTESEAARLFTGERGTELSLGVANVSIPDDHRMGELETPRWWRLEFRQNPEKHVVLQDVTVLSRDHFIQSVRESSAAAAGRDALILIHGYNVGFSTAIRQAAQVTYDLNFPGVAMAFSWPSEDKLLAYPVDEGNARWTESYFRSFLQLCVSELGLNTVHLLAHSMGNRVLAETLGSMEEISFGPGAARVQQVIMAAPDIDSQTLLQLSAKFSGRANRFTLYASSNDKALEASRKLHKYPRAGDTEGGVFIAAGIDTIDASAVDTSLMGHSYFGTNRSVISDIFNLVREGHRPDDRFGLGRQEASDGVYWIFRP
jgi:esterase/lipase superfamily enzyme